MEHMSSWEFAESIAFEMLEPDPARQAVVLLAELCLMYANTHRDAKSKPQPYTLDDFLPNPYAPTKAEREAAFAATMAEFARRRKERLR